MKTFHRMLAAALGIGMLAGAAQAQTVDQRHADQQHRVDQGLRSGSMTPGEAHRVEHQQHSIDRQENRMRDRNGGRLNGYDRAVLQHRENRASRHIYHAKHNGRRW
ncbi:hypothetical protein [uncultured Sphingomonas sp.]|uniref:hypothetical protein n=1 Tax=uncultured Sphingomonas sp. TaxID=158754 RepID=UPI0026203BAA|nr:hypothetical protein [uncultured Sphingomonas sp.]